MLIGRDGNLLHGDDGNPSSGIRAPGYRRLYQQSGCGRHGVYIMKFFCPFYWILAILQVASGTIRGTGKTLQTMLIFLLSLCIFRVLWIWGALAVSHEIFQVMVAYPLSWVVGALLILLYAWKGKWMPASYYKKQAQ